jgi:hypothetical protein
MEGPYVCQSRPAGLGLGSRRRDVGGKRWADNDDGDDDADDGRASKKLMWKHSAGLIATCLSPASTQGR